MLHRPDRWAFWLAAALGCSGAAREQRATEPPPSYPAVARCAAQPKLPPPSSDAPRHAGPNMDPEAVRRAVRSHVGEVQGCYDALLARDRHQQGRLTLRWVIDEDGRIGDTCIVSERSTMPDDQLGRCVAARLATWEFPRPASGATVISYGWIVRPSAGAAPARAP